MLILACAGSQYATVAVDEELNIGERIREGYKGLST